MPASSINLGLQSIPDLQGVDNAKVSFHLIQIYNAFGITQQALDAYTGNTPANPSVWSAADPGSANILARGSTIFLTAGTALLAGHLVAINAAGKAIHANSTTGVKAIGLVTAAVVNGAVAQIYTLGTLKIFAAGTLVPGTYYYAGDGGLFLSAPPVTTGATIQCIGYATLDTEIYLLPQIATTLVP